MRSAVVQLRDGATGEVLKEGAPSELQKCQGCGANWVHQRLRVANFSGTPEPRDFLVKLGTRILAFDADLCVRWTYDCAWSEYGACPACIPAVGDIDDDGRDEVCGGYFLLDHDGKPLWEKKLAPHMDSVAVTAWDNQRVRAICSGFGHVLDHCGRVLLKLGEDLVPHGQEVRVARFDDGNPEPQMVIRAYGHEPAVHVVNANGEVLRTFELNPSPNNTGMTVVYWNGPERGFTESCPFCGRS